MNKRYIMIGLLAASFMARGQPADSSFAKRVLHKTEVNALFSLYTQDGSHSAVTGGRGTEKLSVYSADFNLSLTTSARHVIAVGAGADLVSSASTDKIDFVVSSASRLDTRVHGDVSYSRNMPRHRAVLSIGTGLSTESDYLSVPFLLSFEKNGLAHAGKLLLTARASFDDLRWGRYNHGFFNPQNLVYPAELRYREWYDTYRRTTWQLAAGWTRRIGEKTEAALSWGLIYQAGLLATPFQRVYFTDDSVRTENFPGKRTRFPLSLRISKATGAHTMVRLAYRFYKDNFAITAHAFQAEVPVSLNAHVRVTPFARVYVQSESDFFRPYKEHDPGATYYTSDYDLSAFTSMKAGIAARLTPTGGKKRYFDALELRYSAYFRSDGLTAHNLSLLTTMGFYGKR